MATTAGVEYARTMGYGAFWNGFNLDHNPFWFDGSDKAWEAWSEGWTAAEVDCGTTIKELYG